MIKSYTTAALPVDEEARLAELWGLDLLDTPPEDEFDELVQLAAAVCGTPMSMVSLVDAGRQWFKASVGASGREDPRDLSFCAHAILQPEPFVVEDARQDERFAENPLVTGGPRIRFYAGIPLESPNGFALGTLCVMDQVPRQLTDGQMRALQVLARQVRGRIELRLRRRELEQALNQRDRAVTVLSASERRFRRFMDNVPMMSFMKDMDGRFTFYNSKLAGCFNVNQTEWLGRTDAEIFPAELAEEYRRNDLQVLRNGAPFEFVEQTVDEAGRATWWKSYKFPCEDENGDISLAGVSIDLTAELGQQAELEGANQRLRELATTDTLTGLRNRRAFEDQLSVEFARSGRTGQVFSVMLLDIDDFKRRNDLWGHAAGDAVLRGLAQILMDTVRLSDLSARYGGEEFVVLLPHTDTGSAMILAHRLMNRLAKATWEEEEVTVSIGIACMTDSTESPQALIRAADDALYAAKRGGKNRIVSSAGDRQGI